MKKLFKVIKLLIVSAVLVTAFSLTQRKTTFANDDIDFSSQEEYYYDLCSNSGLTDEQKNTCRLFRNYLADKQSNINADVDELQNSINEMKANIANEGLKLKQYNEQIDNIQAQIKYITNTISKIENNIEELNLQIKIREEKIEDLNNQIKTSMVASQANFRTNNYIKFIMGATSFVDLLRRINAINTFTSYNRTKIEEMENEKVLLLADKNELQNQKDSLIEQQADLEVKQNSLEKLKAITQELIDEYKMTQDELVQSQAQLEADAAALDKVIGQIDNTLRDYYPSTFFGPFVNNKRIYITSGCYRYAVTTGSFHAAIDIALLGYGTPIYPIINAYVMATNSSCYYDGGYLGNTCGGGAGNYVYVLGQIGNKIYCVYYMHLKDVYVSPGDLVFQYRTVIGTTGNSGSSSGPHLHLGILYLGNIEDHSIEYWANQYKSKGVWFGLSYSDSSRCDYRNNKAPCFLNPTEIYGYYYHGMYTTEKW